MATTTYRVRFWVDVLIDAESEPEALTIAEKLPIKVMQDIGIEQHEVQVASIHFYDTEQG